MAASGGKFTVKFGAKKLKIWKVKITKNYRWSTVGVARREGEYGVTIDLHAPEKERMMIMVMMMVMMKRVSKQVTK